MEDEEKLDEEELRKQRRRNREAVRNTMLLLRQIAEDADSEHINAPC